MFVHLYKQYYKHFFAKYNFGKKITNTLLTNTVAFGEARS